MSAWQPDILGEGYEQQTFDLGDDGEGSVGVPGTNPWSSTFWKSWTPWKSMKDFLEITNFQKFMDF